MHTCTAIPGIPGLPALLPNYEYRIHEIRLHGFGTDEPGEMIDRNALSFTVTVNPWTDSEDREHVMN